MISALIIFLAGVILVFAANPSTKPNPGHASNEIMVNINGTDKTLQQAIDDGDFANQKMNIHGIYHKEFGSTAGSFTLPTNINYPIIAAIPIQWHFYDNDAHMSRQESNIQVTISADRRSVSWSNAGDSGVEIYVLY